MASVYVPRIDPSQCIGCELCVKLCPSQALSMIHEIATVDNAEDCDYSGVCQEICPTQAITLPYLIVFPGERRRRQR
jgi:formate hydrogenlyase subunit 6/NADH:ubiquinone oxidoreductase subunit I